MKQILWNRKTRYRPYTSWSQHHIDQLRAHVATSPWRTQNHIQPFTGLLNDPCAFNYFNGKWHLFYQQYPYGPVHGLKSWHHLTSSDLVTWQDSQGQLLPGGKYDSHGVYTGSGYVEGSTLHLVYTGNVRDKFWNRHSYQMDAILNTENQVFKTSQPMIASVPVGYTNEFRDPYVFDYKKQRYCLVGSQTQNRKGTILLYKQTSHDFWQFRGHIQLPQVLTGYMVECPNIAFVDGHVVLIYCPQGLSRDVLPYENIYPNIAVIADDIDLVNRKLIGKVSVQQLDDGFEFYAARVTDAPDGRRLLISWIGLPEVNSPTERYGWAHCLSYVRTLHVRDHHLYLLPCKELNKLLSKHQQQNNASTITFNNLCGTAEIALKVQADQQICIKLHASDSTPLKVLIDTSIGKTVISRLNSHGFFEQRTGCFPAQKNIDLRLFIDESVFECFVNDGFLCMSGRFYPSAQPQSVIIEGIKEIPCIDCWNLERSNDIR